MGRKSPSDIWHPGQVQPSSRPCRAPGPDVGRSWAVPGRGRRPDEPKPANHKRQVWDGCSAGKLREQPRPQAAEGPLVPPTLQGLLPGLSPGPRRLRHTEPSEAILLLREHPPPRLSLLIRPLWLAVALLPMRPHSVLCRMHHGLSQWLRG